MGRPILRVTQLIVECSEYFASDMVEGGFFHTFYALLLQFDVLDFSMFMACWFIICAHLQATNPESTHGFGNRRWQK